VRNKGSYSSPGRPSNNSSEKVTMLGLNKLGHGDRRDQKPRWTVLANASSNMLEGTELDVRVVRSRGLIQLKVKIKVTLLLTVSQSWCQAQSGAHDQIFITV
jgi:ribosomal protein L30/L7E